MALQKATLAAATSLSLLSCSSARPPEATDASTDIQIVNIATPRYEGAAGDVLKKACQAWRLSTEQAQRFFQLSKPYESRPYNGFYQLPCSVSGELEAEGKTWTFEINGGATATWRADGEVRHWGCSAQACRPLVLMPTDSMEPEGVSP